MTGPQGRFRRRGGIEEAPLQGEVLLFDPVSSEFYLLNRTMAHIWRACDGMNTAEIVANVTAAFEGTDGVCIAEEVATAIAELVSLGLATLDTGFELP